jgi:aromatic ring-opening dioxygenase catalytic subunit (LigB family)
MSDTAYLDQAALWSKELTRMKSRGSDTEDAMRRVEREYGIDYGFLWSLRYRRDRLRTISISVYESIRAAYRAECGRQMRKLENDIAKTEEITGPDSASVRSSKALVGKD